jgi:hypothetical protein
MTDYLYFYSIIQTMQNLEGYPKEPIAPDAMYKSSLTLLKESRSSGQAEATTEISSDDALLIAIGRIRECLTAAQFKDVQASDSAL